MMKGRIDVSVLVPVLNEERYLRDAARAMLAQQFDGTAEFLFIDGGSEDGSRSILAELAAEDPRVRVLDNPARRTPQALNIGLKYARGEFVARMDAHTFYPPQYLSAGLERIRHGDAANVGGAAWAVGTSPGSRRVARALRTALGTGGAQFRREHQDEIELDSGFAGVWRQDLLEALGGWDEGWVNDQDTELAARIRKSGGRIICIPEMAADYVPRETLEALVRQYVVYGRYRVKTANRHPESLRRSQLLPPALVVAVLAAAVGPSRRFIRGPALAGLVAYGATLLFSSGRAALEGDPLEALSLPAVWATMHLGYGVGFVVGCAEHGVPFDGILRALGAHGREGPDEG
jgi:glycosyltransferase involved in cell wall biosynthesis